MKAAPKLQEFVTRVADKHGVDLAKAGAYLRLELAGHGQLVIENIGGGRISVTNYVDVNRNWMADPQIVLYVVAQPAADASFQRDSAWIPLECTDFFDGWRLYAELDDRDGLALYDPTGQAQLARFSDEVMAGNLRRHGWLDRSQRSPALYRTWSREEILARDIRLNEMTDAGREAAA